jgi:antirestriction protein ArdC
MSKQTETMTAIANKIADLMETNGNNWVKPWVSGAALSSLPINAASNKTYRGINLLLLAGRSTPVWATYRQWAAKGAQVLKGSKGTGIVFWQPMKREDKNGKDESFMILKNYTVFNADQVEGYEYVAPTPIDCKVQTLPHVDEWVANTGADVRTGEAQCYYNRTGDFVNMPARNLFFDTDTSTATESYYSSLLHELTHWTGSPERLDRVKGKQFGDDAYAFEELIAELGATFLCAQLGISNDVRPDHAQYIKSWIKKLRSDPKFLFQAASKAQKAIDLLNDYSYEVAEVAA